jgi:hypothetical protein
MTETETEHERKVREYWARAYDDLIKSKDKDSSSNKSSITKELNVCDATIYKDIKFLTDKSKQYMYDMAKGTHILMYQRAIEGISLTLAQAWDKFNDPKVPEKQKVGYH